MGRPLALAGDPRPLPDAERAMAEIGAAIESLSAPPADTRLEDDLADLVWSFVNVFHRKIAGFERALDDNEQAQRRTHPSDRYPLSFRALPTCHARCKTRIDREWFQWNHPVFAHLKATIFYRT